MKAFAGINAKLDQILDKEQAMSKELDDLTAAVTNEGSVTQSAITLLQGLSAQIAALKDDPAALEALAQQVNQQAQALADAVTANTPTAGEVGQV
jgi:uncharacterized protein YPO0396